MNYYPILDEATLNKTIQDKLSEIGLPILLENPDIDADFPCIVMQAPLSRPIYMGAGWDISVTLEVWGNRHFYPTGEPKEAADYFTILKATMLSINFQCTNQIPAITDMPTRKIRYGGYFETRWNSTINKFERKN